jgi:predicted benzoate:H+ symporter BenE
VFSIAGPAATASGAVLGAISGALIGCIAGIRLGTVLDEELLCHHRCNDCSNHF